VKRDETENGSDAGTPPALRRYQENTDLPLMVLAVSVIPLVGVEFAGLGHKAEQGVEIIYGLIWAAFLADYVIRLILTADKRSYVRREWLSLVLVIVTVPIPSVPYLEILRSARALRLLRVFRFGAVVGRGAQRVVRLPKSENSQLAVALASFILVTLVSAVLVLAVEEGRNPGVNRINGMDSALWWAISTVSTVGYGDVVPATTAGRLLALIPMLAGVLLVAVIVSNLAQRLWKGVGHGLVSAAQSDEDTLKQIEQRLGELSDRLARLEYQGRSDIHEDSASSAASHS
jgi:voltage-gated potassium channel